MTYAKIYKLIDKEIDKLILDGNNKIDIINAIDYLSNFIGTNTFKEMKYYKSIEVDKKYYRAIQSIAKILIIKLPEYSKELLYLSLFN